MSQLMYSDLNKNIEQGSSLLYIFIIKITVPSLVVPNTMLTLHNYVVLDLDDES